MQTTQIEHFISVRPHKVSHKAEIFYSPCCSGEEAFTEKYGSRGYNWVSEPRKWSKSPDLPPINFHPQHYPSGTPGGRHLEYEGTK